MAEGYCNRCKIKKEIVDAVEVLLKNGRKAIKGKCSTCGSVIFKIIGGKPVHVNVDDPPQKSSDSL